MFSGIDVQRDRRGSPLELIVKVGPTSRETFYDIVRKRQELDRSSVDVESLMIEGGHLRPFRERERARVRVRGKLSWGRCSSGRLQNLESQVSLLAVESGDVPPADL